MKPRIGWIVLGSWLAISCGDDETVMADTETGSSDTGGGQTLPPPDGGPGPDGGPASTLDTTEGPSDTTEGPSDTTGDLTESSTSSGDESTSTGEPPAECTADPDCDDANVCTTDTCDLAMGTCTNAAVPDGDAAEQTDGDCQVAVCSGGVLSSQTDDQDVADDGNPCTTETCSGGVPGQLDLAPGEPCGADLTCDGQGNCVGCVTAADCTGLPETNDCQARACNAGMCEMEFAASGAAVTLQTTGNCSVIVCDGQGGTIEQDDDGDLPDDANDCTADSCEAGEPLHDLVAEGSACGNDLVCNAVGECVGCLSVDDCGGEDTFCQTIVCTAGTCGVQNTLANTPVTGAQTPGDCQVVVCDGGGGEQSVADDADLPADDGNACTQATCNAGVASQANLPSTTACGSQAVSACDGADTCDGAGSCAANLAAPGTPCPNGAFCDGIDACNAAGVCVSPGDPCPSGQTCDEGADTCVPDGACTTAADCAANEQCIDGVCVPTAACTSNADCAVGESCVDGVCTPTGACSTDADCPFGESCVAGVCTPTGGACSTNADCAVGESCVAGVCTPTAGCVSDADCNAPEQCIAGVCLAPGGSCTSNADCLPQQTCISGVCSNPGGACTSTADCGAGEDCIDGVCAAADTDVLWCFETDTFAFTTTPNVGTGTFAYGSGVSGQSNVTGNGSEPIECPGGVAGADQRAATGTGWNAGGLPGALTNDDCYHFSVATQSGPLVLRFDEQRSNSGPPSWAVAVTPSGPMLETVVVSDQPSSLAFAPYPMHTVDLSTVAQIENQPSVQIRICGYGASLTTGTWRIDNVRVESAP